MNTKSEAIAKPFINVSAMKDLSVISVLRPAKRTRAERGARASAANVFC
jgi:hypothetical protein